jgi:hypothetical protein
MAQPREMAPPGLARAHSDKVGIPLDSPCLSSGSCASSAQIFSVPRSLGVVAGPPTTGATQPRPRGAGGVLSFLCGFDADEGAAAAAQVPRAAAPALAPRQLFPGGAHADLVAWLDNAERVQVRPLPEPRSFAWAWGEGGARRARARAPARRRC